MFFDAGSSGLHVPVIDSFSVHTASPWVRSQFKTPKKKRVIKSPWQAHTTPPANQQVASSSLWSALRVVLSGSDMWFWDGCVSGILFSVESTYKTRLSSSSSVNSCFVVFFGERGGGLVLEQK